MVSSMILELLPNGRYNFQMRNIAGMMIQTCGVYGERYLFILPRRTTCNVLLILAPFPFFFSLYSAFQGNAFYMREYPSSIMSGWVVTAFTGNQIVFFNQQFGFVGYVRQQFYNPNPNGNPVLGGGFSFAPQPLNSSNNGVASQVLEGINNSGVLESVGEALGNLVQGILFEM